MTLSFRDQLTINIMLLCSNCPCYKNLTDWGLNLLAWDHLIMLENVIIERYWIPVMCKSCLSDVYFSCGLIDRLQLAPGHPGQHQEAADNTTLSHAHTQCPDIQLHSHSSPLCCPYPGHNSESGTDNMYISSPLSYVHISVSSQTRKQNQTCPVFSTLAKYSSSL